MAMEYGSGGNLEVHMDGPFAGIGTVGAGGAKLVAISVPAANWKGGESPYSMPVGVDGITVNSKVDVQLSAEQMVLLSDKIITLMAQNNGGVVTLYSFGDKPDTDLTVQATVTETNVEGVILGNSASTGTPRSDYDQQDNTKADFIKNKPNEAIKKAQDTADSAVKTAGAALPRSGGTMTGTVDMGGKKITNVPAPEENADAANKGFVTDYVDSKRKVYTLELPAGGWTGAGPYTQTVAVEGILATDMPHYGVVYDEDQETRLAQKEAFVLVDDLDTADGAVTFTCFEDKPEVNIPIQMEVHR